MKTLLIDLTSLDTPSRRRGSGRYVRDLAVGLSRVSRESLGELRLVGLTHLNLDGTFRTTDQLDAFDGSPELLLPTARDHYHWAYARRFALARAARKLGADAVHLGDPHATPLLMGWSGCRRIVTCHDAIPMHFPERYMGWRDGGVVLGAAIERRRYQNADLVIAISDATLADVLSIHRVPKHRVKRVYNGVDVTKWSKPPSLESRRVLEDFGLERGRFALFVGGYHWHKNVEGMVGGIARARAEGTDISLVWAGQLSQTHRDLIMSTATSAGIPNAVRLIGYASDEQISVLYRCAVAHTLLSRFEGFGLTVIEAMASGCPVVTTKAGSLAEIAGDAAITVDPEDVAGIGAALTRLATDAEYHREFAQRGRARAPEFDLEVQARAMVEVYRTFLNL